MEIVSFFRAVGVDQPRWRPRLSATGKGIGRSPGGFAARYRSHTADFVASNGIPNAVRVAVKVPRRVIHRYSLFR
jgi:hypothetical protein